MKKKVDWLSIVIWILIVLLGIYLIKILAFGK